MGKVKNQNKFNHRLFWKRKFGKNSKENFERMVNENQGSLDFSAITKFNK